MNELLIQIISTLSNLLSIGKSLESIFHADPPLADVLQALKAEIAAVFMAALEDADIIKAAGTVQAARDFVAFNYVNAVKHKQSNAEIYTLLTTDSGWPGLNQLLALADTMVGWATGGVTEKAQKAVSLYCTLYTLAVGLYRSQASVAPDAQTQAALLADAADYATEAIGVIRPIRDTILVSRMGAINVSINCGALDPFWNASVIDNRLGGDALLYSIDSGVGTANSVFGAWIRLLTGSSDPAVVATLQSAPLQDPTGQIAAGQAFGAWFAATKSTLSALAVIGAGG